ncbi:amidohydrolase family protein [Liquorilactobacillus mali]|uniref:Metal-dependent hydrolase n=1 Tax=Liquorilactobacillus mali KCTC 3596 = DSM 20444 TaxID=1046596 RepID=J0L3Y9_9LACO|nr:amidohydrolase family protein [Liquorilactobacillus mali]EJE97981.1 metal-dependent hydrolase [Liquorilactobacillus mali KCTC 3596 = DSM 20444]KRN09178.1 metal-dependent hydrolase [Liquorilactobacillus mali KCTC 3596 = DSM 20444]MDV7757362.1 amidohydrolase family protein [Liquorilactobacillus mali]QFQ73667.1 amidohydrolase family protein [Liquorilactobacillus mali]
MIIDANVYWLPEKLFTNEQLQQRFIQAVNSSHDSRAMISTLPDGSKKIVIEEPIGQSSLDYFQNDYQLDKQLSDMDSAHVDKAILKLPGCQEWLTLDLCKIFNRAVAEHIKASHGRMTALATVPPYGTPENLAELDYCITKLGLKGLQLSTHYQDGYLDNPAYRSFFQYVAAHKIPVYVHHSPVPIEYESIKDYENLRRSYGRCSDQVIAISREVFSDLFVELPNLKLAHSMLGGGYFTYKEMLLPHDSGHGRFSTTNTNDIKAHLENNIFYEISHAQPWGKDNLEIALKVLGEQNVIYGSSYPVKQAWLTQGPEFIEQLNINSAICNQVLNTNAKNFYNL